MKITRNILIILAILVLLLVGYCIYLQYNSNPKVIEKFTYPSVSGSSVKITADDMNDLNLYAVFVYGDNGNVINTTSNGSASQSSNYYSSPSK